MSNPVVAIGISDFEDIVTRKVFYVDKTNFIKEWYESEDQVTLLTRPRRFGKTLTLSMVECFFSKQYANRADMFENFKIWKDDHMRALQGSVPVIHISLANVKSESYEQMLEDLKWVFSALYEKHSYLLESAKFTEGAKAQFSKIREREGDAGDCANAIWYLSQCMKSYYGQKVYILVDEYDTPILEAYAAGYWELAIQFVRRLFHITFKDNPNMARGLMTGITRITQESVFSDLNNLRVVTTTVNKYADCFGFTEQEVFEALDQYGLSNQKDDVKYWYDGFKFGEQSDIYNPWSIINYLSEQKFKPYWMNTSRNSLVSALIQKGNISVKHEFEQLINHGTIATKIDEAITYAELSKDSTAIWSWFLTTGYVKIVNQMDDRYEIALTNYEVYEVFCKLIERWFQDSYDAYSEFIQMMLDGNAEGMQVYLDRVIRGTFSYFDVGNESTDGERSEQFYHGFTVGLIADLYKTHIITSNRESGLGRYDVCIEPRDKTKDGIIIEFKIFDDKKERTLEQTAQRALKQIVEKQYEADLHMRGIQHVRKYGIAFRGKQVLIEEGKK